MDKTTNELEEEYFKLVYGLDKFEKFDKVPFKNDDNSISKEWIHHFVDSSIKKKSIIEDFNKVVMGEYHLNKMYRENINPGENVESYLEYYKKRLIQEIRNIKLKGIC